MHSRYSLLLLISSNKSNPVSFGGEKKDFFIFFPEKWKKNAALSSILRDNYVWFQLAWLNKTMFDREFGYRQYGNKTRIIL